MSSFYRLEANAAEVETDSPPTLDAAPKSEVEDQLLNLQRSVGNHSTLDAKSERSTLPLPTTDSGGEKLPCDIREQMEAGLGVKLSNVRVHTDNEATESAAALRASAYTTGRDIYFARGQYAPHSIEGQLLLAHELTHVLQQSGDSVSKAELGQAGDRHEEQAKAVSARAVQGKAPLVPEPLWDAAPTLQRFESPEHIELGDYPGGPDTGFILLSCHNRDLPQRLQPVGTWPLVWQTFWVSATSHQRRALVRGLTYGEVVAMSGDMYADFTALNRAPLREVVNLVPLLRSHTTTTSQFQAATGGRYLDLAEKNISHFSNVPVGQRNRDIWRENHVAAIQAAKSGNANLAWGLNAAGDHFLTDAFSGGHIRTPRAALTGKLASIESKILHDLDNSYGVEVSNLRKDPTWIAYGDNLLNDPRNAQSRGYALEAVRFSKQDIADALAQGAGYPTPTPATVFLAETLIPFPINPSVDRWTGRTPTYSPGPNGPIRNMDDYSQMENRIILAEGPGVVGGLLTDDDDVQKWVSSTDAVALGQQSPEEKLRMINTLIGGVLSYITDADLAAIIRILNSVTSNAEMQYLQIKLQPRELDFTSLSQRTRFHLALYRKL
jgi:hypothetical protein